MHRWSTRSTLALFALTLLLGGSASARESAFLKPGIWRGEFTVNGDKLPFNFEVKGRGAENTTLVLINGTRRDTFKVTQPAPDQIFVKMNTYDAAIEARIESNKRLVGVYKSLVPSQRGSELPFVGEYGKRYRFVDARHNVRPQADLNGKWAIEILSKDSGTHQVALLKQKGNHLSGVFMTVVGDTRELEGTVQGDSFYSRR